MSLLANIANEASTAEDQEETVSSGSSFIKESGCYIGVIKMAKVIQAGSGAVGIAIELETEDGKKANLTEWIQSGTEKGNKTFYVNKEGKQINLPGFTKIKNLNFLINGVFGLPTGETKEIKEYDWELKQEVTVPREVITSWLGKPVGFCVQATLEDKYNDETSSVTKSNVEHFYDPVTEQFGSEKMHSKPAENLNKFKEYIEKNPVKDKRKKSKGSTAGNTSTSGSQPTTPTDVGF